jgi:ABC-type multidrug transport system ATPase subunit
MIFLDEPTSGLDASASIEVCGVLHTLAQSGLTIVAVIHQPRYEIVDMFDGMQSFVYD